MNAAPFNSAAEEGVPDAALSPGRPAPDEMPPVGQLSPSRHIHTGVFTIDVAQRNDIESISRHAQEVISFYNNGKIRSRRNGSKNGSFFNNLSTMANTNSSEESRPYASRRGRASGNVASRTIDEGTKGAAIRVDGDRQEQA